MQRRKATGGGWMGNSLEAVPHRRREAGAGQVRAVALGTSTYSRGRAIKVHTDSTAELRRLNLMEGRTRFQYLRASNNLLMFS
ncbi:hypothetical protein chiPu_0007392 [Chiloscyllium punctatum]|uniref:Uncharacterized protein n=1 Tax=Chiloscyllium punctatum TaxID=137246 RepID=A0A401SEW6_CHIPU|nr:hypothetical protein [Chiloscyllium punctatum]